MNAVAFIVGAVLLVVVIAWGIEWLMESRRRAERELKSEIARHSAGGDHCCDYDPDKQAIRTKTAKQ